MDTATHKLLAAAFQISALLVVTQSRLHYAVLTVGIIKMVTRCVHFEFLWVLVAR
jgi:hypothetical protein